MSYPLYSRAERIADGAVHVLGVGAAIIGVAWLFILWSGHMGSGAFAAFVVYSGSLLLMLTASAAYHMGAYTQLRPILRRVDHAAIYVKIAGTFTPLSVMLGTAFGYMVLGFVWGLALIGASAKLMAERGKMTTGWVPYIALGWIGVVLIVPLVAILPVVSLALIVTGGLIYTVGVLFYVWESLKFANAIWHVFVLAASACFFFGITTALHAAS